jgi:hypothetical protein
VTRDVIRVAILADPLVLAVVLKLVVAVQLLAVALNPLVVVLAVALNRLVVHQAVALKQLVVQHRAIADVERRSIADFSPSYSLATARSLAMKVHVMLVQHHAALARLQQLLQQKQLQQQHQLQ